ncbi:NAD(P)H-dependent oxidoreductase [Alkalimonas collagenimarina]|uniref:FMN dependent NADH:quinone oxidoreductase n=1 Tax=Alkalimonas collagenimarina TaxID=400390 RepID=A0ABT9GV37_9GAMM|nr:NAD(P)H-dependent oxidoreductase [Alkalimonas collagenimarina]MDP4534744.1 NAD(P)H-dependent oxidoreductase [Alkalimonas collagenimarina]
MPRLLVLNSSGRTTRSITRRLTKQYTEGWLAAHPDGVLCERDLTLHLSTPVNEAWIASAFAPAEERSPAMEAVLAESETLLAEIEAADALVLGVPMYNFGVPAQLKAYFDQIIRAGRSFQFDPDAEPPYQPLLADKPVTIIVSVWDGDLLPGGPMAELNFLEPHLLTMLGFIGLHSVDFVRVGYEEYQDGRLKKALGLAETEVARRAVAV